MEKSYPEQLALLGNKISGAEAVQIGIAHHCFRTDEELEDLLGKTLSAVNKCAPGANAKTKALMLDVGVRPLDDILEEAATLFSQAVQGPEGFEGTMAFIEKRSPKWVEEASS